MIAGFKIRIAVEEDRFRIGFARRNEKASLTLDGLYGIGDNCRQHHLQMSGIGPDGRQVCGQIGCKTDPGRSAAADQGQDLCQKSFSETVTGFGPPSRENASMYCVNPSRRCRAPLIWARCRAGCSLPVQSCSSC